MLRIPAGTLHALANRMGIRSFRDLEVWNLAMDLVDSVYDVSEPFPRHEWFGLRGQVRRAAVAIPSHIAEGSRQRTTPALVHYLAMANSSGAELETQLEIAIRRRFAPERDLRRAQEVANQVSKMLYGLTASLERRK